MAHLKSIHIPSMFAFRQITNKITSQQEEESQPEQREDDTEKPVVSVAD